MMMPGRKFDGGKYRYGFNGKENDSDVKGEGNQQDYGMRIYDPRLGKFLSVDPLTKSYPHYTPYSFAGNKPIWCVDLDGAEDIPAVGTSTPSPFSTEYLVNWAKNDGLVKGAVESGKTVILIQNYIVIESGTGKKVNVNHQIILNTGAPNSDIVFITQDNATFGENGNLSSSQVSMQQSNIIKFGTPEFFNAYKEIVNDKIPIDQTITFGPNSRKLSNEEDVIQKLKPIADFLNAYPDQRIEISSGTNLKDGLSTEINSDNERITVEKLLEGRSETLKTILTEKLKVNTSQVEIGSGKQNTSPKGDIFLLPQTQAKDE